MQEQRQRSHCFYDFERSTFDSRGSLEVKKATPKWSVKSNSSQWPPRVKTVHDVVFIYLFIFIHLSAGNIALFGFTRAPILFHTIVSYTSVLPQALCITVLYAVSAFSLSWPQLRAFIFYLPLNIRIFHSGGTMLMKSTFSEDATSR